MDQSRFQESQAAYDSGDFRAAAKGFLASAGRGPDGNGAAYHMAGNSLMRLRRYQDAVTVYGHALRDQVYDRRGAVLANLGVAYVELGEYAEAARSYERALEEPDYSTPYKAYQGMAGALLERGRVEDAAVAYRKAALDPGNPDPGKALVNLGLCFMGLSRPADAVEAYRAALGFDAYKGRGLALANLGLAFVALGEYDDAVKSFEKASQMHGHTLSAAAASAYAAALAHVRPTAEPLAPQVEVPLAEQPTPVAPLTPAPADHEVVEGWETGQVVLVDPVEALPETPVHVLVDADDLLFDDPTLAGHTEGWDRPTIPGTTMNWDSIPGVQAEADPVHVEPAHSLAPFDHVDPTAELGFGDENAVNDFFSATDEELKERDREARRAARHERGPFAVWRTVGIAVVAVVIVIAALIGSYQFGYGWPTQTQTVGGMLSAFQSGLPVTGYWVAAPTNDISKEMAKIPPVKSFTVDNVSQGAQTSKAQVTVTPKTGAALHYTITLSREGVGWKVSGVDNDWSTTGG